MTDILDRKQLSDGIFFSRITDGRFKTNRISITFYNEFSEGRRSDYAILPYILTDSCRNYPNLTRLTERYSDLYGASVSDNLGCSWDRRSMTFTISSIDDRYTLNGEKLEEQAGEHIFKFRVKLDGETKVQAVAGDCIDDAVFRKVDAPNPDYKLTKKKSTSANWV